MTMEIDPDLEVFGQVPSLLATKHDTSQFVAITILRSILESREDVRQNERAIQKIWHAIPKKFLVRLLKSTPSEKVTAELSKDLAHLAVGIIHSFLCLLIPNLDQLPKDEVTPLNIPLLKVISTLDAPQRVLAWQTIQRVAEKPKHNTFFDEKILLPAFWDLIKEDERTEEEAMKFFRLSRLAWGPRSDETSFLAQIENWELALGQLLKNDTTQIAPVYEMLAEVVSTGIFDEDDISTWLPQALSVLKNQLLSHPTPQLIHGGISLSATLLHDLPPSANFPSLLFISSPELGFSSSSANKTVDSTFAVLFPNILIVELRSSIPSLMSSLNQPSYPSISLHLSRTFDLLSAFISVLMTDSDSESDDDDDSDNKDKGPTQGVHQRYDADTLLRFRSSITETLSLSIEYLRDRYDAAKGGTRGLHPDMRAPNARIAAEAKTGPLPLTWDASALPMSKDPLILAILRLLALWLAEDDESNVMQLTSGLIDVLVELFEESYKAGDDGEIDFRNEVLVILEALFEADGDGGMANDSDDDNMGQTGDNGVINEFLGSNGWEVLSRSISSELSQTNARMLREWTLVRVLMMVLNSDAVVSSRESWMSLVRTAASRARDPFYTSRVSSDEHDLTKDEIRTLEDEVAVYLLAVSLVLQAPSRKQVLYKGDLKVIEARTREILDLVKGNAELEDLNEELEEVMGGMEELGVQ